MEYIKGNLKVTSDFEIRIIREDSNQDIDLFIDMELYTLNIVAEQSLKPMVSRLQFPNIRALLIRLNAIDNKIATIVVLKNIDIHSQAANFEVDYSNYNVKISKQDFQANLIFESK